MKSFIALVFIFSSPSFASTLDYGKPVKFFGTSGPIRLHFPDFDLKFLKQMRVYDTIDESGPSSVVDVFQLTGPTGKKSEISVVAAAGRREEGPKFKSNKKSFRLIISEFNGNPLAKDQLVVAQ